MTDKEFSEQKQIYLNRLPLQFRSAVDYYCWEKGHSYGYQEVINYIQDMVAMLEKPIQDYKAAFETKIQALQNDIGILTDEKREAWDRIAELEN